MKLWILRHGEAEPRKTTDAERALTARGRSDAAAAGRFLQQHTKPALVIAASPYLRAQQTALAAQESLPGTELITVEWCTPDDDPLLAIDYLAFRSDAELLLVSHQPFVSELVGLLLDGNTRLGPPMHTASLVELDVPIMALGQASLLSLRHAPEFVATLI
jgi:phosphohistidine phosphatase